MRRTTRARTALSMLVAVGSWLAVSSGAQGASVVTDAGQGIYTFQAGNGEANNLTIDADATNYTFTDSAPITDVNGACTPLSASSLRCPRAGMNRVRVELAVPPLFMPFDSAPNTFRYNGTPPPGTGTEVGLRVRTGLADTVDDITGSSGNDELRSFDGSDTVAGGGGADLIADTGGPSGNFSGGEGNDEILASGGDNQTIAGGDGDDSLDGGDTMMGEGGNDTLHNHGDFGGSIGDHLDGGAGNDLLVEENDSSDCSFTVSDTNIGGPGEDEVYDDCGTEDVFKLEDGEADKWHCGGIAGKAELDPSDKLVAPQFDCDRGPDTEFRGGPDVQTKKRTAKFKFRSDNRIADFECKLDKKKFKGCKSPKRYKNLDKGKHVFKVRAVAGDLVGKPAKWRWKITDNPR
jgi:hypothetical protein